MTKSQLITAVANAEKLSKAEVNRVLDTTVESIVKAVKKGDPVRVPGLGTFRKRTSKARMGRNPATGEPIKIPARTRVRFTPAKEFKEAVLGGKR